MNITQIRNATIVVKYANKKFLIDPMLAEKGTYATFPETIRQDLFNPLVSLPTSIDNILDGVDAVIVT
ncbi:MBL fold metallo-hydrolase, partial [Bacillus inaquosorum]|nr:MBL fold metallo-hydrolase [Bacillus inaquosorum]